MRRTLAAFGIATLAFSNAYSGGEADRVRVDFLEPTVIGGQWPFVTTAILIACDKSNGTEKITLGWEAPPPDGTGDMTAVELLATPPYIGKTLQEGRSSFVEIVSPNADRRDLDRHLKAARARAETLCQDIGN